MVILEAKEGKKLNPKTALQNGKIPMSSISQIPELQLNPLLGRLLETAREDIGEDEVDFDYFLKILKVLSPETDPQTKKRLLFRMIDITGDQVITRREFVLFFVNVFLSRSHFNEEDAVGDGCLRGFRGLWEGIGGLYWVWGSQESLGVFELVDGVKFE